MDDQVVIWATDTNAYAGVDASAEPDGVIAALTSLDTLELTVWGRQGLVEASAPLTATQAKELVEAINGWLVWA